MSLPFSRRLVLNGWMLSMFGASRFEELADLMRREEQEGLDEHNVHRFYHALVSGLPDGAALTVDELLGYDQDIVRHTRALNEQRLTRGHEPITWKYFQYLALLVTENVRAPPTT